MTPQERFDRAVRMALATLQISASERIRIREIIAGMTTDIAKRIALTNLRSISKANLNKLVKAVDKIINDSMTQVWDDDTYAQFWQLMAVQTSRDIDPETEQDDFPLIPLAALGGLLITGGTIAAWRMRTVQSMRFRIGAAIRQGVANGENSQQVLARIVGTQGIRSVQVVNPSGIAPIKVGTAGMKPTASGVPPTFSAGVMPRIVREHEALVNTTLQRILADARMAAFRRNRKLLKGIRQVSILDDKTTTTCIAYSGAEWTLDLDPIPPTTLPFNNGTPRHFNCRSLIVEIRRGDNTRVDPSFAIWLARQPADFQDAVLGKGRAQLWREGKMSLSQLVSGDGNPLTLSDLRALYA